MNIKISTEIITKTILNEETGELYKQDFKEIKETKKIKGGFRMVYKEYDEICEEVVNSNKELRLFHWIKSQFTYQRVETYITYSKAVEDGVDISKRQFSQMIKKLVELEFLKRVTRGIYRMNPFMYLPYRADTEELQAEWNKMKRSV